MGQTGAEFLMQQGEKRGEKRGELKAKREVLLDLMTTKFGSVPPNVRRRINAIRNTRRINEMLKKGFTAETIEEIGIE
jgi:hypothetical protein